METLFMGQANMLTTTAVDGYHKEVQQRYTYLKNKFKLSNTNHRVQFAQLRPSNFPTIRLGQLAALYSEKTNLFQELLHHNHLDQSFRTLKMYTEPLLEKAL